MVERVCATTDIKRVIYSNVREYLPVRQRVKLASLIDESGNAIHVSKTYSGVTSEKSELHTVAASSPQLIEFNDRNKDREMPYFAQDTFIKAEAKGPLTSKEYLDALEANHRLSRAEGIDGIMDKLHLDAIMAPTGSPAWLTDLINGDHAGGGSSNAAAVAGYPDITVPAGSIAGLPVGVSFFGRAWSEAVLLKIAYGFEQAINGRKPPRFLATIDKS